MNFIAQVNVNVNWLFGKYLCQSYSPFVKLFLKLNTKIQHLTFNSFLLKLFFNFPFSSFEKLFVNVIQLKLCLKIISFIDLFILETFVSVEPLSRYKDVSEISQANLNWKIGSWKISKTSWTTKDTWAQS